MLLSDIKQIDYRVLLLVLSIIVRCLYISSPDSVVFDENHYLKFILMYFKGETVIDVHPPLGRLLAYFITKVYLRKTEIDFSTQNDPLYIGKSYSSTILSSAYLILRSASAVVSCVSVLVGYEILLELQVPKGKAMLSSLLFLFEGTMHSIFRLFMIDSYVLVSISLILLSLIKMNKYSKKIYRTYKKKEKIETLTDNEFTTIHTHNMKKQKTKKKQRQSIFTLYTYSLMWSAVLGVFLGVGSSFKWAVLPMGAPIAIYLLADLIRARQKTYSFSTISLPFIQGALILSISIIIYISIFIANFTVQKKYSERTENWFSFSYNATLEDSPYSQYRSIRIDSGARIDIGIKNISKYLTVENEVFSVRKEVKPKGEWRLSPVGGHALRYNTPLTVKHESGLYLSSENHNFISKRPSTLYIVKTPTGENALINTEGKYLSISETEGSKWTERPTPILLLYNPAGYDNNDSYSGNNGNSNSGNSVDNSYSDNSNSGNSHNNTYNNMNNAYNYNYNHSSSAHSQHTHGHSDNSANNKYNHNDNNDNNDNKHNNHNDNHNDNLTNTSIHNLNDTHTLTANNTYILSSVIKPLTVLEKVWESNKVMYTCNNTLSGTHKYKSSPSTWLYNPKDIHMWSGATAEHSKTPSVEHPAAAQVFLVANPIVLSLSLFSLCFYILYLLTTEVENALTHTLILSGYFTNYLPYFLLLRDTYTHHYIPAYYISMLILSYSMKDLRVFIHFSVVILCGIFFTIQHPILTGYGLSYEQCRLALKFTHSSSACELFDSLPE